MFQLDFFEFSDSQCTNSIAKDDDMVSACDCPRCQCWQKCTEQVELILKKYCSGLVFRIALIFLKHKIALNKFRVGTSFISGR